MSDQPTSTELAPVDLNNPIDGPRALERVLYARAETDIAPYLEGTGITVGRFIRTVIHAVAAKPDILECTGSSIIMAVLEAARMGLEPVGRFGGAYLVPRRRGNVKEAHLEVDWRGFIRMAQREGAIRSASADVVYEGDHFEYRRGTSPMIDHRPSRGPAFGEPDRGNITHFYAIVWLPDGSFVFEVMTRAEVDAIRGRAPASDRGPWVTDYVEMGRKTTIRRVFKYQPDVYNPALQYAIEREDRLELGSTGTTNPSGHDQPPTRRAGLASAIAAGNADVPTAEPQEAAADPRPEGCVCDVAPDGGIVQVDGCPVHPS